MRIPFSRRPPAPVGAWLVLLGLVLGGCGGPPPPPPATLNERPAEWLVFEGDGRGWLLVEADLQPAFYMELLALPSGSVEPMGSPGVSTFKSPAPPKRTERGLMVERRLVFVPGGGGDEDVQREIDAIRARVGDCAASNFEMLARGSGDGFLEWSHSGCSDRGPEHEITRLMLGRLGVHRAALRAQGGRIPEPLRRDWLRILVGARLTGGS